MGENDPKQIMLSVFVTYHYFLGLTNLDIITDAIKFIKENHDVDVDLDVVNKANDPAVLSSIYSKGLTNGVFQFESSGMRDTLIGFAPKTIDDVALLNAAYRPGPMQYIKSVTDVKFGREQKKYIVPEMAEILDETYGKPIYQEQIQKIFANIAGFEKQPLFVFNEDKQRENVKVQF